MSSAPGLIPHDPAVPHVRPCGGRPGDGRGADVFRCPTSSGHIRAVDGGVWANSPTTIALAEATHGMGVEPERIQLLSVGTTYDTRLLGQPAQFDRKMVEALVKPATNGYIAKLVGLFWKPMPIHGKLGWLPNIAGFLMKTQSQTAGLRLRASPGRPVRPRGRGDRANKHRRCHGDQPADRPRRARGR